MPLVRWRLVETVVLIAALLWAGASMHSHQNMVSLHSELPSDTSCGGSTTREQQVSGPEISVVGVSFSGALQMPVVEQEHIADSVKQETLEHHLTA